MDVQTEELTLDQAGIYPAESLKEMIDAGVFYGRKKNKTNPKVKPYIFGNRGGVEIIDLGKTLEGLNDAIKFLKEKIKQGGMALLVGTQPAAQGILALAKEFNFPIVDNRWIGGTLTNFKIISKRIEHLKKLKIDLASGALQKYTKKERLQFEREIKRLTQLLGGLENLTRKPDVLIVVDPVIHVSAVREALKLKIPVISFINTDADPDSISHHVIGNNAAKKSIEWFLEKIGTAIREAKAEIPHQVPQGDAKQIDEKQAKPVQ